MIEFQISNLFKVTGMSIVDETNDSTVWRPLDQRTDALFDMGHQRIHVIDDASFWKHRNIIPNDEPKIGSGIGFGIVGQDDFSGMVCFIEDIFEIVEEGDETEAVGGTI
jgi:hypothetical protein